MIRILAALLFIAPALLVHPRGASAQTATSNVTYGYGFNMVGAPSGTDLSFVPFLYQFSNGTYLTPNPKVASGCTGYWGFFLGTTSLVLSGTAVGPSQNCDLQSGWNLVGNPFDGDATLPAGSIAYHWNAGTQRYDAATTIPAGGAVWVYVPQATTITIQFAGTVTEPAPAVVISNLSTSGPYTIHVGDRIELLLPSNSNFRAQTSPALLKLISAGQQGNLSCLTGTANCAISIVNQFWIWQALIPGTTTIFVSQVCTPGSTGTGGTCLALPVSIEVDILP